MPQPPTAPLLGRTSLCFFCRNTPPATAEPSSRPTALKGLSSSVGSSSASSLTTEGAVT